MTTRRFITFGLRSLFLLLTTLCISIGWFANRAHRQREAVSELRERGCKVIKIEGVRILSPLEGEYSSTKVPLLGTIGKLLGDDYSSTVVEVDYSRRSDVQRKSVTDEDLDCLQAFSNLRWLSLSRSHVGGAGLKNLNFTPRVISVVLDGCPVTDNGLSHLPFLQHLGNLDLRRTKVTDESMRQIGSYKRLRYLHLSDTGVTDAGMKWLRQHPSLEYLNLENCAITDAEILEIATIPKLNRLYLSGTQITDHALTRLTSLGSLDELEVFRTEVSWEGIQQWLESHSKRTIRPNTWSHYVESRK